jgi:hypothetical protein
VRAPVMWAAPGGVHGAAGALRTRAARVATRLRGVSGALVTTLLCASSWLPSARRLLPPLFSRRGAMICATQMRRLAEECARCDQLEWLVALPLSPPEEAAVIGWLETQVRHPICSVV